MTLEWIVSSEQIDYSVEEQLSEIAYVYFSVKGKYLTNDKLMQLKQAVVLKWTEYEAIYAKGAKFDPIGRTCENRASLNSVFTSLMVTIAYLFL